MIFFFFLISNEVRTKHEQVRGLAMHVLLIQGAVKHFNVASSTVNVLFMFHGELDNQIFALIAEGRELLGQGIEAGILGGLNTWGRERFCSSQNILNVSSVLDPVMC